MNMCLATLLLFMSDKAGMPHYEQGWVIHNKNVLFYTWYTDKSYKEKTFVQYIAAAKSLDDLENKNLEPYDICHENGKVYTLFKLTILK